MRTGPLPHLGESLLPFQATSHRANERLDQRHEPEEHEHHQDDLPRTIRRFDRVDGDPAEQADIENGVLAFLLATDALALLDRRPEALDNRRRCQILYSGTATSRASPELTLSSSSSSWQSCSTGWRRSASIATYPYRKPCGFSASAGGADQGSPSSHPPGSFLVCLSGIGLVAGEQPSTLRLSAIGFALSTSPAPSASQPGSGTGHSRRRSAGNRCSARIPASLP